MSSQSEALSTTLKFQRSLITSSQHISPELAALHAIRHRRLIGTDSTGATTSTLSPLHCSRCGTLGTKNRLIRPRKVKRKRKGLAKDANVQGIGSERRRVYRQMCTACGKADDQPRSGGAASLFPKYKVTESSTTAEKASSDPIPIMPDPSSRKTLNLPVAISKVLSSATPSPSSSKASTPVPSLHIKVEPKAAVTSNIDQKQKRPKKKTGLQEMLARHREQQQRRQEQKQDSGGLASFLSEL